MKVFRQIKMFLLKHKRFSNVRRDALLIFLKDNCIIRKRDEVIVGTNGQDLSWLIDTRIALLNPSTAQLIGKAVWDIVRGVYPCQIACLELTGIPLLAAVQACAFSEGVDVNGIIIRRERKKSGRRRQVEGTVTDVPIVFVDDIFNGGGSIVLAQRVLREAGRDLNRVVSLISFEVEQSEQLMASMGVAVSAVYRLSELGLKPSMKTITAKASSLSVQWEYEGVHRRTIDVVPVADPVLADGIVYFCDQSNCLALDQGTGDVIWKREKQIVSPKGIRSTPALGDGRLYVADYDGRLACHNTLDGDVLWTFEEADWIGSSPCLGNDNNRLFVGLEHSGDDRSGSLVCLDSKTGNKIWEWLVADFIHSSPILLHGGASVAVGTNGGELICCDCDTGVVKWSYAGQGAIKARPTYDKDNDLVIFGTFENMIAAVSASTGVISWKVVTHGSVYSEPVLVGTNVVVSCTDKMIYIIDRATGGIQIKVYVGGRLLAAPTPIGDYVYSALTGGLILRVNVKTQEAESVLQIPDRITTRLKYSSESQLLFVATLSGRLVALSNSKEQ